MKFYYYLLYRLYRQLQTKYDDESIIVTLTTSTSTFILSLVMLVIYAIIELFYTFPSIGKSQFVFLMIILGVLNYFLFVRNKKFLKYGFKEDKRGGYILIITLCLLFVFLVLIANQHRKQIIESDSRTNVTKLGTTSNLWFSENKTT